MSIDGITLSSDGRQAHVSFVGAAEFRADSPCSADYRGSASVDGDQLVIEIYALAHPIPLPSGMACDLIGYPRSITLELPRPFIGNLVRDDQQLLFLGPPEGLAVIKGLPNGWKLRDAESLGDSMTPRWMRTYSPAENAPISHAEQTVTIIQSFNGPVGTTGPTVQPPIQINGESAMFYIHEPTGEMVAVWPLGHDEVALVAYLADFTREEFIALAESVTLPDE